MKLSVLALSTFTLAMGTMALGGCSDSDGQIEVTAASTPLTEKGGDQLFTIKLVDAAVDGYALETLVVKITPEGKSELKPTCTPNDANGNKKLEKNETVTCVENSANELDASIAGKPVKVALFAKIDGEEKAIGEATWTVSAAK
jgi:hypothetical protein